MLYRQPSRKAWIKLTEVVSLMLHRRQEARKRRLEAIMAFSRNTDLQNALCQSGFGIYRK